LVHLRDNVVAHAPDVALILGDWGMDDQFYAFLTSLWVVFNSNFWAALAGAFGGAVAASKFASRQQKRDDLVRIVNETNAAISISYSACEAYLTHKLILIDDLTNAYHRDFAAYRELQSEGPDRWPSISLNMTEPTLGQVQCSALQDLVFRIPSTTAVIRLVAILNHRNATLHGHMVERNELIRAMRLLDAPDRTALFFGLAKKDGFTDKTYPHLVDSLSELITDCIFFSWSRRRASEFAAAEDGFRLSSRPASKDKLPMALFRTLIIMPAGTIWHRAGASWHCRCTRSTPPLGSNIDLGRPRQAGRSSVHLATCQTLPTLSPFTSPGFLSLA
jgi:hypothetical protein